MGLKINVFSPKRFYIPNGQAHKIFPGKRIEQNGCFDNNVDQDSIGFFFSIRNEVAAAENEEESASLFNKSCQSLHY